MAKVEKFEDLNVWKDSRQLVSQVYEALKSKTFSRDFEMKNQMQRAALSAMTNIAEGFERGSNKEFIYFLNVDKGSSREVRSLLYTAADQGLIAEKQFSEMTQQCLLVSRRSSTLITYLSRNDAVGMGSARASRAVFRALAEHRKGNRHGEPFSPLERARPTGEGAGRNTRGRVCSPTKLNHSHLANPTPEKCGDKCTT